MKTYEEAIKEAADTYKALRIVEAVNIRNSEFRGMRDMIAFVYGRDAATVRAHIEALLR